MKPLNIYFAGEWGLSPEQGDLNIYNRLVSYLYPRQFPNWTKLTEGKAGNIILDSGAFSAWNRGKSIDIEEYIKYAHTMLSAKESNNKKIHVVNLDVIPGRVGETKRLNAILGDATTLQANKEVIENAAKKGFQNMKTFIANGITPIHVYHQGEDIKWLDRMLHHTNYIGVSPANDMTTDSKRKWIYTVFEYLHKTGAKVDTHGFAVMVPELLRDLPWTSCDAISWRMIAATGSIVYPKGGFTNPMFSGYEKPFEMFLTSERAVAKGLGAVNTKVLALLLADGYTYEDLQLFRVRAGINAKTFILFENWVNEYKKDHEFKPNTRLF